MGGNKTMKLKEALKHKEYPYWIKSCSRKDLPILFKELGFKKGVEVGVSWGQNIVDYCEAGLEIDGIDPWKDSRDNIYRKIISIPGKHGKTVEDVYNLAKERTKNYPKCRLIRKTSEQAADDYPDRSLDFVYIDGNHNFGYIAMDLMLWANKVKRGGIIAGHDYYHHSPGRTRRCRAVGYIVDAFAKCYDFENWYVLGTKDRQDGDDEDLSFLFIKHW